MISDVSIDEVRRVADIVEVAQDLNLPVKKTGATWKALCPFHDDHDPSMSLSGSDAPRPGLFYCFACHAGGDVFKLVQRVEACSFVDAVERLARRYGVELEEDAEAAERRVRRARLSQALDDAADWWQAELYADGQVLEWLYGRGVTDEDVDRWRVGWAPADGGVVDATGAPVETLSHVSLVTVTKRGPVDFFRGRIMFPIRDEHGATVGAAGRTLDDDPDVAKYINSRSNDLYDKSRILYGLHEGRAEIVRADRAVVVEGYTDVIASHRAGVPTAVATCGTALTEHHLRMLGRRAKRVGLCFDADRAGADATLRYVGWQPKVGVELEVVGPFPPGQDPAEVGRTDPDRLREVLEAGGVALTGWAVDRALAPGDMDGVSPEDRARAVAAAVEVADAAGPGLVEDYRRVIAERSGLALWELGDASTGRSVRPVRDTPDPHDVDLLAVAAHDPGWVDGGFVDPMLFVDPDYVAAAVELAEGKPDLSGPAVAATFTAPLSDPAAAIRAAAVEAGRRVARGCPDPGLAAELVCMVAVLADVGTGDEVAFADALGMFYGAADRALAAVSVPADESQSTGV